MQQPTNDQMNGQDERELGGSDAPSQKQELFDQKFPHGYKIIHTSAAGNLCMVYAIVNSMSKQYPDLQQPTAKQLLSVLDDPAYANGASLTDMTNKNNFSADQGGSFLHIWGSGKGLNLQLGYLPEGAQPQLVPTPNESNDKHVIWVHNDNIQEQMRQNGEKENADSSNHWSGLEPKGQSNVTVHFEHNKKQYKSRNSDAMVNDASAKDDDGSTNDEAANGPKRRRWSDTLSGLARPVMFEQVKAHVKKHISSPTSLRILVEQIENHEAQVAQMNYFYNTPDIASIVLSAAVSWPLYSLFLLVRGETSDFAHGSLAIAKSLLALLRKETGVELVKTPEACQLQNSKSIMEEMLNYHQLEILCRYGDYLSERLDALRHYVKHENLETNHKLSKFWTETSTILKGEEVQEVTPCRDLILAAAQGLNWNQETTFFMVHQYAKRNSLMHAELFELVNTRNWLAIGQRCEEDTKKLRELFIDSNPDSNPNSNPNVENWVKIIEDFRNRWICRSKNGLTWEARLIIREAIADQVDDWTSLNKLSLLPEATTPAERRKRIDTIKTENALQKTQGNKMQRQADDQLREENRLLQARVERLEKISVSNGASKDCLKSLAATNSRIKDLEKENKRYKNRFDDLQKKYKDLKEKVEFGVALERGLTKILREKGLTKMEIGDIKKAIREERNARKKNTDTGAIHSIARRMCNRCNAWWKRLTDGIRGVRQ